MKEVKDIIERVENLEGSSYAVWKDETYEYCYGTIEQIEGKEVVEYCKDFEEARLKWKYYYYR